MVVLLVFLSFAIFSLSYLAPGSALNAMLGTRPRTPELVHALQVEYHLNESFFMQYWHWAGNALHLDFGTSIQSSTPVTDQIKSRLPISLFLGTYAFLLTLIIGILLGVAAALHKDRILDRATVAGSAIAVGVPPFVSGVFALYLLAIVLPIFPVAGGGTGFTDELLHLTLPAFALSFTAVALVVRYTRTAVVAVLDQDYVTFARARGLSTRRVLATYVIRNALIPIVTVSGLLFATFITGAVIVESTFSISGIGSLLIQSVNMKDLPMLQGVALVIAVTIILANLVADLIYLAVDPRIRIGRRQK